MKRFFILFFVLFYCSCSASVEEVNYQISEEKINIKFDLQKSILICNAEIKVLKNSADRFNFKIPENAESIDIFVDSKNIKYKIKDGIVEILIDKAKSDYDIKISYYIKFDKEIDFANSDIEDPSSNLISHVSKDGVFIGGDVIWYPVFNTIPEIREITFISERNFEFMTEGVMVNYQKNNDVIKSTWFVNKEIRSLPILGGPYLKKMKKSGNLQLMIYSFRDNIEWTDKYLNAVEDYINFYSNLIGPYPYEKFAVVETYLPVGISYQTFTIISKELTKLPFIIETSLPHEILHSWFGNGVFVDYRKGNWSEGLVTYLADYLIKERKSKKDAIDYLKKLTIDYSTIIKDGEDFPLKNFYGRYDLKTRVIGYGKAAMFFHYLRFFMGDEKFFGSIKNFYKKNLFKTASWDDLRVSFSEKQGDEIKILFKEWVERDGAPSIRLTNVSKKIDRGKWIISFVIEQGEKEYLLKLPVNIYGKGDKLIFSEVITLKEKRYNFNLQIDEEPLELRINENYDVLRRLTEEEIPATVNSLKSARNILFLTNSNNFDKEFINIFVKTMGINRYEISQSLDDSFNVIVNLGLDKELRERDIIINKNFFKLKGEEFNDEKDAIFLVLRKNKKIIAYFQAFSKDGAMKVAHKLTHYGPFSYLVFRDGVNVDKGLIEPERNSLKFKF